MELRRLRSTENKRASRSYRFSFIKFGIVFGKLTLNGVIDKIEAGVA
jgi:hypothetical protein